MSSASASMPVEHGFSLLVRMEIQTLRCMAVDYAKASALELYVARTVANSKAALSLRLQSLLGTGLGRQGFWKIVP